MMEDVILSAKNLTKIIPFLRMGGIVPTVGDIVEAVQEEYLAIGQ
jgi:hypothetical protein